MNVLCPLQAESVVDDKYFIPLSVTDSGPVVVTNGISISVVI